MLRSLVIFPAALSAALFLGQEKSEPVKQQTKSTTAAKEETRGKEAPANSTAKKAEDSAKATTKKEESSSDKDAKKSDAKKSDSDGMHKVETEFLKQDTTLSGVFEATSMTEVLIRPESWSEFTVAEAVEHGAKVKKGESLITF